MKRWCTNAWYSFGAEPIDSNNLLVTGTASARGGHVRPGEPQKVGSPALRILHAGMSQNAACSPGCLSRVYDSWVWFGIWFVGMIRGIVIYPHLPPKCFKRWWYSVIIIPYVGCFGAGMLLPLCVLLSEWCVRFGAGMVVPLDCRRKVLVRVLLAVRVVCTVWSGHAGGAQGAAAGAAWKWCLKVLLSEWCVCVCALNHALLVSGCRWKVLLEGAVELARWCCFKGDAWGWKGGTYCTQLVLQGC